MLMIMMKLPRLTWALPFCLPPLYSGALDGKIMSRLLRSPVMAIPGGMCYSIFLYHPLVIQALEPYVARLNVPAWPVWANFAIAFAILLPAILLFSAVLYALAEKPFMIMARNLVRERARRRAEQAAVEFPAGSPMSSEPVS
jgi:peptidoglycan/LPS O-acetylase OafA/YrhL